MAEPFVFHRTALAERMADVVLGLDPLAGDTGLFLAAPRRTGKSTFLQVDLVPALERRGVLPIYVDLWADRSRDPAALILDGLRAALRDLDAPAAKMARRTGLAKIGIGAWFSIDLDRIGQPGGATMTDVIRTLVEKKDRPVVLVVDEAQHATTTPAGTSAMFALKSARDTLNANAKRTLWGNVTLGLLFTGSNRDKLASLVTGKNQPFFGSAVTAFPLLGRDYTDAYTAFINARLAPERRLHPDEVFAAFKTVESRPQLLLAAISAHVVGTLGERHEPTTLAEEASLVREGYWSEFDAQWAGLSPLQQAVLRHLIETGVRFRPFETVALASYAALAGHPVTTSDAQSALDALREKGLVVRLERGVYTLDDASLSDWFAARFPRTTPAG